MADARGRHPDADLAGPGRIDAVRPDVEAARADEDGAFGIQRRGHRRPPSKRRGHRGRRRDRRRRPFAAPLGALGALGALGVGAQLRAHLPSRSGRTRRTQSRSAHSVVRKASLRPGDRLGAERADVECLGRERRCAAHDPRFERDNHDGCLRPRVEAHDLARLDQQACLLQAFPDRPLVDGLVDLHEATRLRPHPPGRLDPAPEEHHLAGLGDRKARHHDAGVDVGDEPAGDAGQPLPVLAVEVPEAQRRAAARAAVERRGEPHRDAASGGGIERADRKVVRADRKAVRANRSEVGEPVRGRGLAHAMAHERLLRPRGRAMPPRAAGRTR